VTPPVPDAAAQAAVLLPVDEARILLCEAQPALEVALQRVLEALRACNRAREALLGGQRERVP
jgi:hypothetical protein